MLPWLAVGTLSSDLQCRAVVFIAPDAIAAMDAVLRNMAEEALATN